MRQKGFASIFLILIVIFAVVGGFYFLNYNKRTSQLQELSPTITSAQEETRDPFLTSTPKTYHVSTVLVPSDWKMFLNKKYHYSFHYPSNWTHTLSECAGPDRSGCLDMQMFEKPNTEENIEMDISEWPSDYTLEELEKGGQYSSEENGLTYIKTAIYSDIPMVLYYSKYPTYSSNNDETPGYLLTAKFLDKDATFLFAVRYEWPTKNRDLPPSEIEVQKHMVLFEQFLSGFKFTS